MGYVFDNDGAVIFLPNLNMRISLLSQWQSSSHSSGRASYLKFRLLLPIFAHPTWFLNPYPEAPEYFLFPFRHRRRKVHMLGPIGDTLLVVPGPIYLDGTQDLLPALSVCTDVVQQLRAGILDGTVNQCSRFKGLSIVGNTYILV